MTLLPTPNTTVSYYPTGTVNAERSSCALTFPATSHLHSTLLPASGHAQKDCEHRSTADAAATAHTNTNAATLILAAMWICHSLSLYLTDYARLLFMYLSDSDSATFSPSFSFFPPLPSPLHRTREQTAPLPHRTHRSASSCRPVRANAPGICESLLSFLSATA